MGSEGFGVAPEDVTSAGQAMAGVADEVRSVVQTLAGLALPSDVSGSEQVSAAYDEAQRVWRQAVQDAVERLDQLSRTLQSGGQTYTDSDRSVVRSFVQAQAGS